MLSKTILVLANSLKLGGRCIAGREVCLEEGLFKPSGGWIRPVRPVYGRCQGELYPHDIRLTRGAVPKILDVVRIQFFKYCNDRGQPENWEIRIQTPWTLIGRAPKSVLEQFRESPSALWPDGPQALDRISVRQQLAQANPSSLVMIRPSDLQIYGTIDQYDERAPAKWRGIFRYNGGVYDLAITDDTFTQTAYRRFLIGAATPFGGDCMLCVSLGLPLRNYHYKLIAAIIPIE